MEQEKEEVGNEEKRIKLGDEQGQVEAGTETERERGGASSVHSLAKNFMKKEGKSEETTSEIKFGRESKKKASKLENSAH